MSSHSGLPWEFRTVDLAVCQAVRFEEIDSLKGITIQSSIPVFNWLRVFSQVSVTRHMQANVFTVRVEAEHTLLRFIHKMVAYPFCNGLGTSLIEFENIK